MQVAECGEPLVGYIYICVSKPRVWHHESAQPESPNPNIPEESGSKLGHPKTTETQAL